MTTQLTAEPAWLSASRARGAELAQTLAWPKPEKVNIERWNLDALGTFKSGTNEAAITPSLEGKAGVLVQRDSAVVAVQLDPALAAQGVVFTSLAEAASTHTELVEKYLHSVVAQDEDKLTALQSSIWNGGVFIYIPRNVVVELPLQATFVQATAGAAFAPRVLLVADTNSSVTYVDSYESQAGAGALTVPNMVEIVARAGAKVRFATLHNMSADVVDLAIRRAVTENDATIEWIVGDLHDGNVVSETRSILRGQGSNSDAKVISIGTNKQSMSLTTGAVHWGRSTDSQMITRAVMRDQASAIINGVTKIEKGATKANGEQTEKVLMLSPAARGDANPILLIDEDDVTAGHAASVGQVNPEQVYYLMSRGVSRTEAERLIINGFLAPVVSEIPIESVQETLRALIERKLQA